MSTSVAVVGIGPIDIQRTEYLSTKVLAEFTSYMAILKEILDKRSDNPTDPNNPTPDDYDLLILTLKGLADLARNGRVEDGANSSPYLHLLNQYMEAKVNGREGLATTYFTQLQQYPGTVNNSPNTSLLNGDMVQSLNDVMKSLKLVGLSATSNLDISDEQKVQALQAWQGYAGFGVENILRNAVALSANAEQFIATDIVDAQGNPLLVQRFPSRSLQSMLEIEYIKTANDIFTNNLNQLYDALNITQDILQILQGIESISSQIRVTSRQPPFEPPTNGDIDDFEDNYRDSANDFFKQLFPSAIPGPTAAYDLYSAKRQLSAQLSLLEAANPNATRTVPGSLASNIFSVIKDISAEFVTSSGGIFDPNPVPSSVDPLDLYLNNRSAFESTFKFAVRNWILDGQNIRINDEGRQGDAYKIQNHFEQAMTSAQNLNDTQREDVRRYLFVFEEFYKSANAMLRLMKDLMSKINKGLNNT